jgi:hypothetical protein
MKFTKRFLMFAAIAGALVLPSVVIAADGDAVAANKWTFDSLVTGADTPAGVTVGADKYSTRDLPLRGGGIQSLKRNQKAYFEVNHNGSTWLVNQSGAAAACTRGAILTSSCASAPLFIATTTAVICIDSDMNDSASQDQDLVVRVCADKDCTLAKSVTVGDPISDANEQTVCGEGGAASTGYDLINIGGQTIFVTWVSGTEVGANGETSTAWIVGN